MKKSYIVLEYILKVVAVMIIWLLGKYIIWINDLFVLLVMYALGAFPPLWILYFAIAYVLWALPIAPRGDISFAKKWFSIPLTALGYATLVGLIALIYF